MVYIWIWWCRREIAEMGYELAALRSLEQFMVGKMIFFSSFFTLNDYSNENLLFAPI